MGFAVFSQVVGLPSPESVFLRSLLSPLYVDNPPQPYFPVPLCDTLYLQSLLDVFVSHMFSLELVSLGLLYQITNGLVSTDSTQHIPDHPTLAPHAYNEIRTQYNRQRPEAGQHIIPILTSINSLRECSPPKLELYPYPGVI